MAEATGLLGISLLFNKGVALACIYILVGKINETVE